MVTIDSIPDAPRSLTAAGHVFFSTLQTGFCQPGLHDFSSVGLGDLDRVLSKMSPTLTGWSTEHDSTMLISALNWIRPVLIGETLVRVVRRTAQGPLCRIFRRSPQYHDLN